MNIMILCNEIRFINLISWMKVVLHLVLNLKDLMITLFISESNSTKILFQELKNRLLLIKIFMLNCFMRARMFRYLNGRQGHSCKLSY